MMRTKPLPPKEHLHQLFDYRDGVLFWRQKRQGVREGSVAGCPYADGYHWIHINNNKYSRHRLVYGYFLQDPGHLDIDHINRIKGDDRIENLRAVTRRQNKYNVARTIANKSGHKGVCWDRTNHKWIAHINFPGSRSKFLGRYVNYEDAVQAYVEAAQELHGEFLCLA